MQDILYSAFSIDRQHHRRGDGGHLSDLKASADVRVMPIWRDLSLIDAPDGGHPWVVDGAAQRLLADFPHAIYLGHQDHHPIFAVDISQVQAADGGPDWGESWRFVNLRSQGPYLPLVSGTWLAYARALVMWHRTHGFCSRCGAPTEFHDGGHERKCPVPTCGHVTYPRTDPAVIMLVEKGDRILLHRQKIWPPGMWSCLAGFVEPGETLEAAVRREVLEESGILVEEVRYAVSQPWPFPASIMIAFTARAVGGTLTPALDEIEDARWFGRDDLRQFDDGHRQNGQGLFLALPGTAARYLIESWMARS